VLKKEVQSSLTPETMAAMLTKLIAGWDKSKGAPELEVLVGMGDLQALQDALTKKLQQDAIKGLTLTPVSGASAGFQIGLKGENMYYDFTDQGLAEMLSQYLNPKLAKILKGEKE
jgi:V/A-type H+-transporting ATPase subunit E